LWDGKIETVGKIAILDPFTIGAEIGDRGFDLDDDEIAATAEGENIGASPIGEREFKEARITELLERAADSAGEKRRRKRFSDRQFVDNGGIAGHRAPNGRGLTV